jgi:hypothetical protein
MRIDRASTEEISVILALPRDTGRLLLSGADTARGDAGRPGVLQKISIVLPMKWELL